MDGAVAGVIPRQHVGRLVEPGEAGAVARRQVDGERGAASGDDALDPVEQRRRPLTRQRRDDDRPVRLIAAGAVEGRLALRLVKEVDLVPDLDDGATVLRV